MSDAPLDLPRADKALVRSGVAYYTAFERLTRAVAG